MMSTRQSGDLPARAFPQTQCKSEIAVRQENNLLCTYDAKSMGLSRFPSEIGYTLHSFLELVRLFIGN